MRSSDRFCRFRDRARARAWALACAAAVAACDPRYVAVAPFRCSAAQPQCPAGYQCDSHECVPVGAGVATFLSASAAGDHTITVQPTADGAMVCWRLSLTDRLGEVDAALVDHTGALVAGPAAVYRDSADSVDALYGFSLVGTCTAAGDKLFALVLHPEPGADRVDYYPFNTAVLTGQVPLATHTTEWTFLAGVAEIDATAATIGGTSVLFYPLDTSLVDPTQVIARTVVGPDMAPPPCPDSGLHACRLQLSGTPVSQPMAGIEAVGGATGAWVALFLADQHVRVAWVPTATQGDDYLDALFQATVPAYRAAYPLAVLGDQLAMAFRLDDTRWQIYWLAQGTTVATATMAPGPTFALAAAVARPGGAADATHQALVLAGALDGQGVTLWSVPWAAPPAQTPLAVLGSLTKISTLVPERLQVAPNSGRYQVLWTENVPATDVATQYNALYTNLF